MSSGSTFSPKYQVSIPKALRQPTGLAARPRSLRSSQKANGVLMIPVPEREALVGIARGANMDGYRDRNDRVLMRVVDTSGVDRMDRRQSALGVEVGVSSCRETDQWIVPTIVQYELSRWPDAGNV